MTIQFLGCGDAFGSGGRFQTCISIRAEENHYLLDCGASSLIAMKRLGVDPASVDAVIVTHLHGDHFGGIPFLILDAQLARRDSPLLVAGPPGTEARVLQTMELLFPGSSTARRSFDLRFVEFPARTPTTTGAVTTIGYEVIHASGAPAYAVRMNCAEKVVGYSGDTAWTDALIEAASGADLFICEAYSFEKVVKSHLAYVTLCRHRSELTCRRIILTHMSADLLSRQADVADEMADDGMTIIL